MRRLLEMMDGPTTQSDEVQNNLSGKRICIIGAGPAGLVTAYELSKRTNTPNQIEILEATGRVGGRVLTVGEWGL